MQQRSFSYSTIFVIVGLIVVVVGAAVSIFNPGLIRSAGFGPVAPAPASAVAPATLAPIATITTAPKDTASATAAPSLTASPRPVSPRPTFTPTATATFRPSRTPTATATFRPSRRPTATPAPTDTPEPLNPDHAQFVADVSVPDGTQLAPGTKFTKTWRIKNVGETTWTRQYVLEYTLGAQMALARQVSFPAEVAPGQTIDLSMDMVAPDIPGDHTSLFQFRNAQGVPFGVGPRFNEAIYARITVIAGPSATP